MGNSKKWLKGKILEFMIAIDESLSSTTYAVDRNIYTKDLAAAARWLIKLYKGVPLTQICEDILSNQTNKYFGDYWRHEPWGENEAVALSILQEQIRIRFNLKNSEKRSYAVLTEIAFA
jgi:hypothetical protein